VEAFPIDAAPSHLIRDGDGIYGERVTRRIKSRVLARSSRQLRYHGRTPMWNE
jgi:hypothetical protein